jgi:alpha-1,3-rhamnosyltransferase
MPGISKDPSLVSVIVMTYNAGRFVIDTLESISTQTYDNIELIISDDYSTDDTLKLCRQWIEENKEQFIRTELITVSENTGVSSNCNRSIHAAQGEWIKFIAADDILLPNCIEDNMKFVRKHPDARIIFSQVKVYQNNFEEGCYINDLPPKFPDNLMDPDFSAEDQYDLLIMSDRINYTPSYFFKKETILKVGAYDETNRLVEDYPMWLKLTRAGVRLHYFHKPTVGYRLHPDATNNTGEDILFKPSEVNNYLVRKKYAHPHLHWTVVYREIWRYRVSKIFLNIGWTKNTAFLRGIYALTAVYFNPFVYLESIRKRIK